MDRPLGKSVEMKMYARKTACNPPRRATQTISQTKSRTPANEFSPATKASKVKDGEEKEPKKTGKHVMRRETFQNYIYQVLKLIHPDQRISARAMVILNSLIEDTFQRIATEAGSLAQQCKRSTLSSHDIKTSIKLLLPGELALHAMVEGEKAVERMYGLPAAGLAG